MPAEIIHDPALWDGFIEESPYGMLFHRWDFLKIIEKHSGYTLYPYGVYRGEELACLFPLYYRRDKGMKMVFSPPPGMCIPYMGFVVSPVYDTLKQKRKERFLTEVADDINGEIEHFSPNYSSFSTVPGFRDARPFLWNGYNASLNYTYLVDLSKPLEEVWEGFDKDTKKRIRVCEKYGLQLKQVNYVREFYDIMKKRFAEMGLSSPLASPGYVEDILKAFPDNIKLYFLYHGEEVVSVVLNYEYKGRLMLWLGDINIHREISGTEYQNWELIKSARLRGFKEVEIEGASIQQVCTFKSKFNPTPEINFILNKKDPLGVMAEWAYVNLIRKSPIKV